MNYSGQKRKFNPRWQKEDSDQEDDSQELEEEEELELKDLVALLKGLLEECQRLSMLLKERISL